MYYRKNNTKKKLNSENSRKLLLILGSYGIIIPMKNKTHWAWKIYFVLYTLGMLFIFLTFLVDESMAQKYYRVLMAFNQTYGIMYYLNLISLGAELLSIIPLFLFTFHVRWLPAIVWQIHFEARILLLLASRSYEWKTLCAFTHASPITALAVALVFILLILPSFTAGFCYAFQRDKLFPNRS
mgnify:CR=1 FL=1